MIKFSPIIPFSECFSGELLGKDGILLLTESVQVILPGMEHLATPVGIHLHIHQPPISVDSFFFQISERIGHTVAKKTGATGREIT